MKETEEKNPLYDHWTKELEAENKAHKDYRDKAEKVVERYRMEERGEDSKFNILWSNTEILHAALYGKTPAPDIRRRFGNRDPEARKVSQVMERAVSYCLDQYDFDSNADATVNDYLLPGLGNARLRYTPYFEKDDPPVIPLESRIEGEDPLTGESIMGYYDVSGEEEERIMSPEMGEDGPYKLGEPDERLAYEEVTMEPIPWNRFHWQPAKRWDDVDWASIDHYLDAKELKDQFPKHCDQIPMGYKEDGTKVSDENTGGKTRAKICEIFDKRNRKVIVIAPGYNEVIEEEDDPLELEGFYPFPAPLFATTTSDKLIPIPDYLFYQDQALELDRVTQRIDKLTEELKYRGVYDGSFDKLHAVANADDGEFISVDDFMQRFEGKGNLNSVIQAMPLDEIHKVIVGLYNAREQIKQTIYEITGIADIMRGATKSSETLGAQQLKTQFGSLRLTKRQRKVARFMRDIIRLKAEIMVEHFSPETLTLMTGVEVTPDMMAIMQNDLMRSYRVDIETDSTVMEDAAQERKDRIDLVTAITTFAQQIGPAIEAKVMPPEVAQEMLLFAVRGFKMGRQLEEALESMGESGEESGEEGGQKVNPEVEQIKQQAQQAMQQMQQEMAALQQQLKEAQDDKAIKMAEIDAKKEIEKGKLAQETTSTNKELELKGRELELKFGDAVETGKLNALEQVAPAINETEQQLQMLMNELQGLYAMVERPKRVIHDANGEIVGIEPVMNS